ncbi:MAG TPA: hypothetical protein VLC48_09240 [Gemmatimonadota bacterium]|nr:hypothetical protein [Gemmatimonadota bacterium]
MRNESRPPLILLALAAIVAALAFQASGPSAAEAIEVDPVIWQLSNDYPETLPGDLSLPISTIYIKTHDAADWMSTYDDHPAAISGPAAIKKVIDIYGAQGIEVAAWFVPKGTDYAAQLQRAIQVIDSGVTALYADLEPFPGFCFLQCTELAENFWKPLRELRPNAHLGVIYDPRPWWWEQSATAEWFSVADSALPMCYWESYSGQVPWGDAAGCVVQAYADLSVLAPGRDLDYLPMLQGNSTAARFEEALDAAAGVGSSRVSVWRRGVVATEVWELIDNYSEPSYIDCRPTRADGCLFERMSTGSVWLMVGGARFLISNVSALGALGLTVDDVQLVDDAFLDTISVTLPDGTLVTDEDGLDVWVVYDGTRFRMGEGDYPALGLDPETVVTIPLGLIVRVPLTPPDFSLLREVSSSEEYLVLRGTLIPLDDGVFAALDALGLAGGVTNVVPAGSLADIPVAEISRGDTDCSGAVETFDVLQVLQLSSGLPSGAICHQSADVNCDGSPASLDALLILIFIAAGESPLLPGGCEPIGSLSSLR